MAEYYKYPPNSYEMLGAKKPWENKHGTMVTEVKVKNLNTKEVLKVTIWNAEKWRYPKWHGYYLLLSNMTIRQFQGAVYYSFNLSKPYKVYIDKDEMIGQEANSDDDYCC